jgi:hypothetical protein
MTSSSTVHPLPTRISRADLTVSVRRLCNEADRPLRRLRRALFGIRPAEVRFDRRGFQWTDAQSRAHLERVGESFVHGYHAALDDDRPAPLAARLLTVDLGWRGFAFEGAAMALVLRDWLAPWRAGRFAAFLTGPGSAHSYMMLVGAGWALARLRRPLTVAPAGDDPLLRWLVADGYGFHEAYFHVQKTVIRHQTPARIVGYAGRVFDQGVGRALWFVNGADSAQIAATIASFPASRRADLWSGIGLACAYAGGVPPSAIDALCQAADGFGSELAQGAAFAAEARAHAENMTPHTEFACRRLTGRSAFQAAAIVRQERQDLPPDADEPAYEVWRRRIRHQLQEEVATA